MKIVGVPENNLRFSNDRKLRDKEIIEAIATELNLHNVQVLTATAMVSSLIRNAGLSLPLFHPFGTLDESSAEALKESYSKKKVF